MPSLLDFPGLRTTTPRFRALLVELTRARGLDPDKVSAIISLESGYQANVYLNGLFATQPFQLTFLYHP